MALDNYHLTSQISGPQNTVSGHGFITYIHSCRTTRPDNFVNLFVCVFHACLFCLAYIYIYICRLTYIYINMYIYIYTGKKSDSMKKNYKSGIAVGCTIHLYT